LVDSNDRCVYGEYPGLLRDVFGIWVEETDALYPDEHNTIDYNGQSYKCNLVCDLIHAREAQVMGVYKEDFYAGMPCVTRNSYGKGMGYYIGSQPENDFLKAFFNNLCAEKGIKPYFESEPGIELTLRQSDKGKTYFILNHAEEERRVELGSELFTDLLTDRTITGNATVQAKDVMVLESRG
jgi:beta-galactosidase